MRRLAILGATGLLLLSAVPVFAASGTSTPVKSTNTIWHATLSGTKVHGGSTIDELANGKAATVSIKLYHVKAGTKITVTVWDGSAGTGKQIVVRESFKAPAAPSATHRSRLTAAELTALKAGVAAKDTLWVTVTATPTGASAATVTFTGRYVLAK